MYRVKNTITGKQVVVNDQGGGITFVGRGSTSYTLFGKKQLARVIRASLNGELKGKENLKGGWVVSKIVK